MKTIIGIDPGASGAISFTNTEEEKVHYYKCHEKISGRRLSVSMALNAYQNKEAVAYIEKVHAMPHDGRSSLFKFGVNYGAWLGILNSIKGITKIVEVSPQKWMKFWEQQNNFKLPKEKKDRKNALKDIASIFIQPEKATLWSADSILITMYGRHQEKESNNDRR
tara:strand:- start:299 stop:793 length:495 start_codon:yes stop_codon:yes gene_type:complete